MNARLADCLFQGGEILYLNLSDKLDSLHYRPGSGNSVEIFNIAVRSGRGIGKGAALIRLLLNTLAEDRGEDDSDEDKRVFAFVRQSNFPAQRFYLREGFRVLSTVVDFYGKHSHAILVGATICELEQSATAQTKDLVYWQRNSTGTES